MNAATRYRDALLKSSSLAIAVPGATQSEQGLMAFGRAGLSQTVF